jgi:hypothetical protein
LPFARRVEGEPRGTRSGDASPGNRLPRCPTRVSASDSEQASRASCRSLVELGRPAERELDSQPGNRRFAARRPSMVIASVLTRRARGNGPLPGVLDLHVGCRRRRAVSGLPGPSAAEGAPGRGMPAPFMRSGGKWLERERQRKAGLRAESEQYAGSPRRLGDPKRVKRHEARHSPSSRRNPALGDDVKLGCSFFEKVGCMPERSTHLATKSPP